MAKSAKKATNPYANIKFSYNVSPIVKKKIKGNTVTTVETAVPGYFCSWMTRCADNKCSYLWPLKEYFTKHAMEQELNSKWGCMAFMTRRLVNEDDPFDNTKMPGTPGDDTSYPFDCLITINPKEDGTAVGETLAASFTKFTQARKDLFGGRAQEFTLKEVLTGPESNRPMVYYLVDEDVVKLFMTSFYVGKDNSKETLYNHEVLLESFFGTVSNGQRLLDMYAKW